MLRVFGKKEAAKDAEELLLTEMNVKFPNMPRKESEDYESTLQGEWNAASKITSRLLSKKMKEPRMLFFFTMVQYKITFNKEGHHSQSQLSVLIDVPTQEVLDEFRPIKMMVAPEGCKKLPCNVRGKVNLMQQGWIKRSISTCLERTERIGGCLLGQRKQYGLCHRIASTIHATMGQDLDNIVTCVSLTDPKYKLWKK